MRIINLIVVHCSATRGDCTPSPEDLDRLHRRRGFNGTGYHYYICKDGTVHLTRPIERVGAHEIPHGIRHSSAQSTHNREERYYQPE